MKIRMMEASFRKGCEALWNHADIKALYPEVLFRMNCMARASCHIMETAVHAAEAMQETEPASPGLIAYLKELIPEERGHSDWVLDDLEALGIPRQETMARVPPPTIASLAGAQYYWIHHHHPIGVLGYIAVMEDAPTHPEIENVIHRTGLPREAFRIYLRHADLEPLHNDMFDQTLDTLPLSPEHLSLIGISAVHSIHMLTRSVEEILRLHEIHQGTELGGTGQVREGNAACSAE